jgi:hypothetical protein
MLERYKSGKSKVGDLGGQGELIGNTYEVARHLENIIRELRALLRDS